MTGRRMLGLLAPLLALVMIIVMAAAYLFGAHRYISVEAIVAEGFERIHRSNLIGMGVLPLTFKDDEGAESLGLNGKETYDIEGLEDSSSAEVTVTATGEDGEKKTFQARVRIDTPKEWEYYRHGGILHYVLRQLAAG